MKLFRFSAFVIAASITLAVTGCKKAETEDWQSATDQASAESLHSDADDVIDNAAADASADFGNKGGSGGLDETFSTCGTVTVVEDTSPSAVVINGKVFPRTITIDFGASTICTKGNGTRELKGKTIITLTAPLRQAGSVATQTFDNFYVDGHKIEGTRTRRNVTAAGGAATFTIAMVNGKITDLDGKTFTWNSTRTRTWTAGFGDNTRSNDEFDITGSGSGVNRAGNTFSATITAPIHMTFACRFPTRGTVVVARENLADRTIDFGNGVCDGLAMVTVNGQTRTINLPKKK